MNALETEGSGKNAKRKSRGSVNNKNRLASFGAAKNGAQAGWGECDGDLIQAVIVLITMMGGACTWGLSRDMGAHSLTLMLDGHRETLWYNRDADLDAELRIVVANLEAEG